MQLTLLVPELLWPEPDDREAFNALICPELNTLIARSRLTRRPAQSLEATLTDAFGHPENAPYAAFRRLGEADSAGDADDVYWFCCDPVHLRFHQEHLILADSGSFDIEMADAQALAEDLNRHFSDVGRFHVARAERWYFQLIDKTLQGGCSVPPLSAVAGRSVDGFRPETASEIAIHKLLTEVQMLLHDHPVNQARENDGQLAINSLWLWGAGAMPPRRESGFDSVWSGDPLALGLARAAGVPTHPVALDAADFFKHAAPDTQHFVVLEDLLTPVQYERSVAYCEALNGLEKRWFAPLRAALRSGRIKQLQLIAPTAYAALTWKSTRREQWKLWRQAQTLGKIAHDLAQSST